MALVTLRQLLDHAAEYKYAVPALNANNLEQVRAIMEAADATDGPAIVHVSAGARKYAAASVSALGIVEDEPLARKRG